VNRIIETTSGRYFTLAEMAFAILGDNDRKARKLSHLRIVSGSGQKLGRNAVFDRVEAILETI
jgi:hypothetical protein